jgi:hypothetical protein
MIPKSTPIVISALDIDGGDIFQCFSIPEILHGAL